MTSQAPSALLAPTPVPHTPASTRSASAAPAPRTNTVLRVAGAIAHLAAFGVFGFAIISLLFGYFAAGLGAIFALGFGLVMLAGFPYMLFALGWLETSRVDGLYSFGLPPLARRRSGRPGFRGVVRTIWLQFIDPRMWRALASFAISSLLGVVVLGGLVFVVAGVGLLCAPLNSDAESARVSGTGIEIAPEWAVPLGTAIVLLSLAVVIGLGILHGVISRALLVPSREEVLAEDARRSRDQREGAVRAADVERTRIERDLHDGVQPRLVSVGMTLGMAQQKIDTDPDAAKALIAEAHTSTKAAITELRQLARGIHASVLDDRGLDAALSALAARSPVPVTLDVRVDGAPGRDASAAMYFAIAESITNAAKHSHGGSCRVTVRVRPDLGAPATLWARIEDDGVGGARVIPGGGLDGIVNRARAAGGSVRIDSPTGGPTTIEVSIPCAS